MYDFLLSEVWWMETIISGVIAGVAGIVAALITYSKKVSKIADDTAELKNTQRINQNTLLQKHDNLNTEHNHLSKEHTELSSEHQNILSTFSLNSADIINKCDAIKDSVSEDKRVINKINEILVEEKAKQELRYAHLSERQQNLVSSLNGGVDAFKSIEKEFLNINEEKISLKNEIENLKIEIDKKNNRIEELIKVQADLRNNNMNLNREIQLTTNKYNDLLKEYQSLNTPKREYPTHNFDDYDMEL